MKIECPLMRKILLIIVSVLTVALYIFVRLSIMLETEIAELKEKNSHFYNENLELMTKVKHSEMIISRDQGNLHEIFPNLHIYKNGYNKIDNPVLDGFEISGTTIKVTYKNNTYSNVKPDLKIYFLNSFGFHTDYFTDSWVFSSIGSGETRIEKGYVDFRFDEPVYFFFELKY